MNNTDLAEQLAPEHALTKADARKLVDSIFTAIADATAAGQEVSITGFGKFKVKETAAREGRNPATGEPLKIAASRKLGFAPAKAVKDRLTPDFAPAEQLRDAAGRPVIWLPAAIFSGQVAAPRVSATSMAVVLIRAR